jgi:DNA-directed RNA polymerase subunit M/transcription elongation factor TFIIS
MQSLFVVSDPAVFRKNIARYFSTLFINEQIGVNVEMGIYNYTIQESSFRQIIKKWKNPHFCDIYNGRLRSMITNIKSNKELYKKIVDKEISPQTLAFMTHQEMCPYLWKTRIDMKIKRDTSKFTNNIEASTDMFMCRKCKSKKCTYYEMQTRSADEPATIFITCLDCGKNWKN